MAVIAPGPYPTTLAAGYDARLRTGAFKFTWTNPYARGDYGNWVGMILHYGATDDGLYFNSIGTSGEFALRSWDNGAMRWSIPFTWTANVPITFTIDTAASTVKIEGAATGSGTYTSRSMPWRIGNGTLRVGSYTSGVQTVDPMIGLIEDVVTGTTANTTSAITSSAVVAAASRATHKVAAAIAAAAVLAAAPSGQYTIQTTSAITSAGALAASARTTAATTSAIAAAATVAGAATARVPSPYEATSFTSVPTYPGANTLITNRWPYGQPLLVRDRVGREVVCPTRSADGNMYLALSEDQGATWRFVSHTSGLGSDPLYNQNLLSCRQDSAGKYHLLSHDPNEGVVYTRFVLVRNGSNVVTGYTREACIYQVFGSDLTTEHVANVVIAKTAAGVECVVLHAQEGFNTSMVNMIMKSATATPTLAAHFTKLDGTAGRDQIAPAGLTHNGHEHVSHAAFFESNGALVFTRSHSAAEGFTDATGYNDLYWMLCPRSGATWSLGAWQRYQRPGEGLHTRAIAVADAKVFLAMPARDSGLHIAAISDDGSFAIDAVPQPGQTYPPTAPTFYEADVGLACSRDGARLYAYIASYVDATQRAAFFADWSAAGGWRKDESPAHAPPWNNYSCSSSTGDGFGIYIARADGTYGNTTPSFAAYRQLGPNLSTTATTTAAIAATSSAQATAGASVRVSAAIIAASSLASAITGGAYLTASIAAQSGLAAGATGAAPTAAAVAATSALAGAPVALARTTAALGGDAAVLAGSIQAAGYGTGQVHWDAAGSLAAVGGSVARVSAELTSTSATEASAAVGARAWTSAALEATAQAAGALTWGARTDLQVHDTWTGTLAAVVRAEARVGAELAGASALSASTEVGQRIYVSCAIRAVSARYRGAA